MYLVFLRFIIFVLLLCLPAALVAAKFVFVREDASIPTLPPCYRSPYLLIDRRSNYFLLQIGSKKD